VHNKTIKYNHTSVKHTFINKINCFDLYHSHAFGFMCYVTRPISDVTWEVQGGANAPQYFFYLRTISVGYRVVEEEKIKNWFFFSKQIFGRCKHRKKRKPCVLWDAKYR